MRLATWNVNSLRARLEHLETWLAEQRPDVLLLQETKCDDGGFPAERLAELGYASAHHGDGRWNGVAILSKIGIEDVRRGFADDDPTSSGECRLISAQCGGIRVFSVYVPNGRALDSPHYALKLEFFEHLRRDLAALCVPNALVAIGGDFNVAPEDRDVWDITKFDGMTHVSAPERVALASLVALGLYDAVRTRHPDGPGPFSWWDYRGGAFHKGEGMRIDLILVSEALLGKVADAGVDREARKKGKAGTPASDHAPVVIDITTDS